MFLYWLPHLAPCWGWWLSSVSSRDFVVLCGRLTLAGSQPLSQPLSHSSSPQAVWKYLLHHGPLHGLQGNLCSGTWSTSFFTDLGVCTVVSLTFSHSSLPAAVAQQVLTLLEYVIPEVLPLSLIGSVWPAAAPSWSQLELPLSYMREASDIFSQKPPL